MKGFIELHFRSKKGKIYPIIIHLNTIAIVSKAGFISFQDGSSAVYEETYEEVKAKIEEATK